MFIGLAVFVLPLNYAKAESLKNYTSKKNAFSLKIPTTWTVAVDGLGQGFAVMQSETMDTALPYLQIIPTHIDANFQAAVKKDHVKLVRDLMKGTKVSGLKNYKLKNYKAVKLSTPQVDATKQDSNIFVFQGDVMYILNFVSPKTSFKAFEKTLDQIFQSFTIATNASKVFADKTVKDTKNNFQITYPFNWLRATGRGVTAPFTATRRGDIYAQIVFDVSNLLSASEIANAKALLSTNLSQFSDLVLNSCKSSYPDGDCKVTSAKKSKLNTFSGAKVVMTYTYQDSQMTWNIFTFVNKNKMYSMNYIVGTQIYSSLLSEMDKIAKSLKMLK
ncbi:MAG: hypothetical protein COT26_00410 [Candidatus Kerfeldbacteria bacterium CG08_land_8_20_14_0_20_43_14]|uniref:Uncharacterized protein n=1 Tax=Candidatus Kerfeldbacteria bacterium CG08_land_8_20_14_0_20_43_14 TaxID=2014246 RepID=A0A2H0YRC7_9BACT|nr:MAG: hypothetical protein COT26_00410 [Candidatus Kerfeldbacteria bacterium CG08_land_8_20_14_0_20_43_14]